MGFPASPRLTSWACVSWRLGDVWSNGAGEWSPQRPGVWAERPMAGPVPVSPSPKAAGELSSQAEPTRPQLGGGVTGAPWGAGTGQGCDCPMSSGTDGSWHSGRFRKDS